eukprot:3764778-Rhodomonas_salina.1
MHASVHAMHASVHAMAQRRVTNSVSSVWCAPLVLRDHIIVARTSARSSLSTKPKPRSTP